MKYLATDVVEKVTMSVYILAEMKFPFVGNLLKIGNGSRRLT